MWTKCTLTVKKKKKINQAGGDDGSRALLNNATIGTIELVEAFEEALPEKPISSVKIDQIKSDFFICCTYGHYAQLLGNEIARKKSREKIKINKKEINKKFK